MAHVKAEDVSAKVLSIIAATQRIPAEKITLDSNFEELGFDSLDAMNILFALESEFNISVPDDTARSIRSVRAAVEGVQKLLEEQAAPSANSISAKASSPE